MGASAQTPRSATPPIDFSAQKAKPETSPSAAAADREAPPTAPAEGGGALPPTSLAGRLATLAGAERDLAIFKPNWAETQTAMPKPPEPREDAAVARLPEIEAKPEAAVATAEAAAAVAKPAPALPSLDRLIAESSEGAAWRHRFSLADAPVSPQAENYVYAFETVGEAVLLRLGSGAQRAPSGGLTAGYNIRVSDELEQAASEKTIRITVVARAERSQSARFAIAYSTNDVGNSGWQWREVGPDWSTCTVEYQVPKLKRGHGDFVGLLPSPADQPAVVIAAVAIAVIS